MRGPDVVGRTRMHRYVLYNKEYNLDMLYDTGVSHLRFDSYEHKLLISRPVNIRQCGQTSIQLEILAAILV